MFSWSSKANLKIVGADGHTPETLRGEIERGAKFVIYSYNFSLLVVSFKQPSNIHFIRSDQNAIVKGLPFTLVSLVFGWWGFPWGIIYTVQSLGQNLSGGKDVTHDVMESIAPAPTVDSTGNPLPPPLRPPPAPPAPFDPKPVMVGVGAVAILAGLIYTGVCFYAGQHVPVALVSGLPGAYDVNVNGQPHHVRPGMADLFDVPEGEITVEAKFPNGEKETQRVTVSTPFFSRPFSDRVVVLNPDSAGVIYLETVSYTATNSNATPIEPTAVFYAGETHYIFDKPDAVFADLPENIRMPTGSKVTTKTSLQLVSKATPPQIARHLAEKKGYPAASRYLTTMARFSPTDGELLDAVIAILKPEDSVKLFQSRLAQRPILVEWHRHYQNIVSYTSPGTDLATQYRALVEAEPTNGDLLYLAARIEEDRAITRPLYERAMAAKPPSAYAFSALAYDELSIGNFERALALTAQAEKLGLKNETVRLNNRLASLGLGRIDAVAAEATRQRKAAPLDLNVAADEIRLTFLATRDDRAIQRLKTDYLNRLKAGKVSESTRNSADHYLAAVIAEAHGLMPEYIRQMEKRGDDEPDFYLPLLRGDLPGAEKILAAFPRVSSEAWLLLYIASINSVKKDSAELYFSRAVTAMSAETKAAKRLAAHLKGETPLTPEEICDLTISPDQKRVILTALAYRQPANRGLYFKKARLFNLTPDIVKSYLANVLPP